MNRAEELCGLRLFWRILIMKLRNIIAAASAAIIGASALAASASAYEAFLMYTQDRKFQIERENK